MPLHSLRRTVPSREHISQNCKRWPSFLQFSGCPVNCRRLKQDINGLNAGLKRVVSRVVSPLRGSSFVALPAGSRPRLTQMSPPHGSNRRSLGRDDKHGGAGTKHRRSRGQNMGGAKTLAEGRHYPICFAQRVFQRRVKSCPDTNCSKPEFSAACRSGAALRNRAPDGNSSFWEQNAVR
jgi:hypothetical protein